MAYQDATRTNVEIDEAGTQAQTGVLGRLARWRRLNLAMMGIADGTRFDAHVRTKRGGYRFWNSATGDEIEVADTAAAANEAMRINSASLPPRRQLTPPAPLGLRAPLFGCWRWRCATSCAGGGADGGPSTGRPGRPGRQGPRR